MSASGLWRGDRPLILASRSPARSAMLTQAGIAHERQPADIDERALEASVVGKGGDARAVASTLARAKAAALAARNPGRIVLGADQTLACDNAILSKPGSTARAREQLRRLSGRSHTLWSAAVALRGDAVLCDIAASATLEMRVLSDATIDAYLAAAGGDVLACAGTYQLEGAGIQLFTRVAGDYWTILGLPMLELCGALRAHGLLAT